MKKVCVIGGGASGMMAALSAAKNGALVTLFEGNEEPGKKILRTGNGRCNFTNLDMDPSHFHSDSSDFVSSALEKYGRDELLLCFSRLGLLIKEKNGYLYPYTDSARSVRDILWAELRSYCVDIRTQSYVNCLSGSPEGFLVSVEGHKERECFDKVILSCGGMAGLLKKDRQNGYKLLESMGVAHTGLEPGLTKLECAETYLKNIDGVRTDARVKLFKDDELIKTEEGEVLFRENGISGICVFILSSLCDNKGISEGRYKLSLDILPNFEDKSLKDFLEAKVLINAEKNVRDYFKGLFCDSLIEEIIRQNAFDPEALITDAGAESLVKAVLYMKDITLTVTGKAGFENAQVTVGGVNTSLLTEYMEVKSVPGLFVVGELVNVDGPCGGYNLQWAFTSGAIAGERACY